MKPLRMERESGVWELYGHFVSMRAFLAIQ